MSKYSRIRRTNTTTLSNSIDFTDHSVSSRNQNSITKHKPNDTACVSGAENPTQGVTGVTDDAGEVFGVILGRKMPTSSAASSKFIAEKENAKLQRSVNKSFSIRRSISLSEGYSRIHDQYDPSVEDRKGGANTLPARPSKKKGQIFKSWTRFFRF